ncbi:uncharacterized protein LOC135106245 [Scylla paramamosain]|uniref:uncharacterized protein LOC135106245 n=1 Tax=Scylla paramamosain TaxID=85552 RepID=UPI003082C32E
MRQPGPLHTFKEIHVTPASRLPLACRSPHTAILESAYPCMAVARERERSGREQRRHARTVTSSLPRSAPLSETSCPGASLSSFCPVEKSNIARRGKAFPSRPEGSQQCRDSDELRATSKYLPHNNNMNNGK